MNSENVVFSEVVVLRGAAISMYLSYLNPQVLENNLEMSQNKQV